MQQLLVTGLFKYPILLLLLSFSTLGASPGPRAPAQIILMSHDANDIANFRQSKPHNAASDINNLLFTTLSHYEVELQTVPIARLNLLLKTGQKTCATSRVKTAARLKENLFSLPVSLYMGLRLYFIASNEAMPKYLVNKNEQIVSLKALFDRYPNRILGTNKGRSYGESLDPQIALLNSSNLVERGGKNPAVTVTEMLKRKRIDYLIDYPIQIKEIKDATNEKFELTSQGLKHSAPYIIGHIACNKTETGRTFIKEANAALKQLYQTPAYYHAHVRYLDRADIPQFNRYFEQVFGVKVPTTTGH